MDFIHFKFFSVELGHEAVQILQ